MSVIKIQTNDVVINPDLYPRFAMDNDAVERYRANLDNLPPIVVAKDNTLIDGKHRLRAHQLSKVAEIQAERLDIEDADEILVEAIRRNSMHGKQLRREEKKDLAIKLCERWGEEKLQKVLAVGHSAIYNWTTDLRKEIKNQRDADIVSMYLRCWTQAEIAEETGVAIGTVNNVLSKIPEMEKMKTPPESLQYFDIWNFAALDKSYGQDYPGRIPGQIVENVLWYFTEPLDVVCDPMAGGGTTIDVCNAMYRRCFAYDVNPVHDRVTEHDMRDGVSNGDPKADLVFFDPPYFKKKTEEYDLPEELNSKAGFMEFAKDWVKFSKAALKTKGIVALLISDYVDYESPSESIFSDEYARLFDKSFTRLYKISVPLSTQQYKAFHVDKAKKNKEMLIRGRELYIFQKGYDG